MLMLGDDKDRAHSACLEGGKLQRAEGATRLDLLEQLVSALCHLSRLHAR